MNILCLATTDEGGAGIVCKNINQLICEASHNSVLVVKESTLQNKDVIVLSRPPAKNSFRYWRDKVRNKLNHYYRKIDPLERDEKYCFHNLGETKKHYSARTILKNVPFNPDVILVFWVSGFVNARTMKELKDQTGAKMFWFMTDNAPITGGCHYPWDCQGYKYDCANCPAILTPSKKDIARKNLAFKKLFIPKELELVSGSIFDHGRAKTAALFRDRKVHKLVAPTDETRFLPGDKKAAKAHFAIDSGKKVIFCGASSLTEIRKGGKYLLESLESLEKKMKESDTPSDFLILVAGRDAKDLFRNIKIPIVETGYLNEENLIKAYQAADLFLCPSLEDSGPLMVNQSIMCGTPVVSFDIGVATDLVIQGKTGHRAKLFDANDLAQGMMMILLLNEEQANTMSRECREIGLKNYAMKVYMERMLALF